MGGMKQGKFVNLETNVFVNLGGKGRNVTFLLEGEEKRV